jgi:Ca2+-dependent lipid-binding protein
MSREKEIQQAGHYLTGGVTHSPLVSAFTAGAEWADKNPPLGTALLNIQLLKENQMSEFKVPLTTIKDVFPHSNATSLEYVKCYDFNVIVTKGRYKIGRFS